jgi:hypothetical protein
VVRGAAEMLERKEPGQGKNKGKQAGPGLRA